jgi:hypothetical protein
MRQSAIISAGIFIACLMGTSYSQNEKLSSFTASVYPDKNADAIEVNHLKLNFTFAGYGVYLPSEYPTLTSIPLEDGEDVNFASIRKLTVTGKRVNWKKYIEPDQRRKYEDIDADGYYHWSDVEVEVTITDWNDKVITSRIKRPDVADVYLVGQTDRGDFRLQLDQENNKTVVVSFKPNFVMQCENDPTHLFPNLNWKYCPICGGKLKKIQISK